MDSNSIILIKGFLEGLKPEPIITVTEWSDNYRYLPETSARPGKFSSAVTPYIREPLDRLSVQDQAQKVIIKKGSQLGFTEAGNNYLGYTIDISPAPFLYAMPTDTMMKDTSKNRIQKMIESTPTVRDKVSQKSRDKHNTIMYKEYRNGFVKMVGANSPVGLSSTAVRYVYLDEIDRYPLSVGGEGSAIALAETRTITFGARKKIFITSTPTKKGFSAIDTAFGDTGQRYFYLPCPYCGTFQILVIDNLRYDAGDYSNVQYECCECKKLIDERFKTRMLNAGKWIPKYPEKEDGITYGYFINALYSPYGWYSWSQMAKERDESLNDLPKRIAFVNTKLGECYEENEAEKMDWEAIYERATDYPKNKPFASVAFLTAGVDVQGDRLELEIVGWMKGKTSQSIDYRVIIGDTAKQEVWDELAKVLNETWVREDGRAMQLRLMCLDTGYNTTKTYEFAKKYGISRVIPIKGRDKQDILYSAPKAVDITRAGKKIGRVKVWMLGVSMIKTEIYGNLKLTINPETGEVPDGYCYLPKREPSFFRGLVGEEITRVINKKNYEELVWRRIYRQNEPLDCRTYSRAAAAIYGMDRWNDERWEKELNGYIKELPISQKKTSNKPSAKSGSMLGRWR